MTCGAAHKSLTKLFCTKAAINLKITIPCTLPEYRCTAVCEFSLSTVRNHLGYEQLTNEYSKHKFNNIDVFLKELRCYVQFQCFPIV